MFRRVNSMLVENEKGVSLQSTGRFQLTYKEYSHTLLLESECGTGKNGEHVEHILFHSGLCWESPNENENLSFEDFERIKNNIREAASVLVEGSRVEFHATRI